MNDESRIKFTKEILKLIDNSYIEPGTVVFVLLDMAIDIAYYLRPEKETNKVLKVLLDNIIKSIENKYLNKE